MMIIQDSSQSANVAQTLSTFTSTRTAGIGSHEPAGEMNNSARRRPDMFVGLTESSRRPSEAADRFSARVRPDDHVDLFREETRLILEIERLRSQRAFLLRDVDALEVRIQGSEDELAGLRAAAHAVRELDRPVLYSIAPVGVPTPKAPTPAVEQTIQITLQHRVAGMHGNLVDVFG